MSDPITRFLDELDRERLKLPKEEQKRLLKAGAELLARRQEEAREARTDPRVDRILEWAHSDDLPKR